MACQRPWPRRARWCRARARRAARRARRTHRARQARFARAHALSPIAHRFRFSVRCDLRQTEVFN